mmetsp:Transcript_29903/g.60063  ORF Transcript_29903/g.60063 Transcript_29903/m.60063 type:complete len:424 (-) Transcript_29903:328-1599(-)|eukprot:CAMPEP_0174715902 /NCGR_PEP_ID=MMETSP1094-20130205/22678_1 /TAXON_ID=156173 /ORGANISM="Chrysochromulina brevifilum, Strain UTEX LB 985" /LENGTH=423 /DNA_ID=CAMNT_0015915569 /DNA_START=110 /DNA_END=1381 /DNA_ORIENTATION=+
MPGNIIDDDGKSMPLPKAVHEQATTKTSVYRQGELIYDGATGKVVGDGGVGSSSDGPGNSLNELLKWGVENSDPEELARRAKEGTTYEPKQIDKEIMDMLLGQPIVAKMRECLGKLEPTMLRGLEGLDGGAAALEELEYYAEDLDNARDLVKISGLATLKRCCTYGLPAAIVGGAAEDDEDVAAAVAAGTDDPDGCAALREAACGVLAAMLQNNPPVQVAARETGVPATLLSLLGVATGGVAQEDGWEARVGGLPVVRKALLALSAFLRGDGGGATGEEAEQAVTLVMPTLSALAAHSDAKLRRRTLFLLASLACEAEADARDALFLHACAGNALPAALVAALTAEDEDTRTQAGRLMGAAAAQMAVGASSAPSAKALGELVAAVGGVAAAQRAIATAEAAESEGDPEEVTRLRSLVTWMEAA